MVIDSGSLVEYDEPDILLSDENSLFYSMAKSAGVIDHSKKQDIKITQSSILF
jgi:hypothetical protein